MNNLKGGLVLVTVGILTIVFRKHFRYGGPTDYRAMFDKEPTHPAEQWIVAVLGGLAVLAGIYTIVDYLRHHG